MKDSCFYYFYLEAFFVNFKLLLKLVINFIKLSLCYSLCYSFMSFKIEFYLINEGYPLGDDSC